MRLSQTPTKCAVLNEDRCLSDHDAEGLPKITLVTRLFEILRLSLPTTWLREFDPFEALENLRETPGKARRLIDGLSEDILTRQPEGGGWSIRQVVAHLKDAQGVLGYRVGLLLKEDNPNLASQAVFEWANRQDAATTQELYDAYLESRQDTLKMLEGASLQDWWRNGQHEEFGELRLWEQVSYFAAHELTHLRQVAALRARFAAQ